MAVLLYHLKYNCGAHFIALALETKVWTVFQDSRPSITSLQMEFTEVLLAEFYPDFQLDLPQPMFIRHTPKASYRKNGSLKAIQRLQHHIYSSAVLKSIIFPKSRTFFQQKFDCSKADLLCCIMITDMKSVWTEGQKSYL